MSDEITVKLKWFPIVNNLKDAGRVKSAIHSKFRKAAKLVGMILEGDMRKMIRDGNFEANSAMTVEMKGSSKPLVGHTGRLFRAITHKVRATGSFDSAEIDIGVMRTSPDANVAELMTRKFEIVVTRKMAIMFRVLRSIQLGQAGAATSERAQQLLSDSKGHFPRLHEGMVLNVLARDFGLAVLRDPKTAIVVEKVFTDALAQVFETLKGGGPTR